MDLRQKEHRRTVTDENTTPPENCNENIEDLPSRTPTDEERYYYEQSYKAPVESLSRLEDTAKFLIGATATTSGLFASAFKLSLGNGTVTGFVWFLPFGLWAGSIIVLLCVLIPHQYTVGRNEPSAWKASFKEAGKRKFRRLVLGALLFVFGIISAIFPFG